MSTIETGENELVTYHIFACVSMIVSAKNVINMKAIDSLLQELVQQSSEKKGALPTIDGKIVSDDESQFKLTTEINIDNYCISLERISKKNGDIDKDYDKQEIYISNDCSTAYVINTMGNQEHCYSYERLADSYNYSSVLVENLSTGEEKLTEAQLALLKDVYEVLGVEGLSYKRVIVPFEDDYESGRYANVYGCIDSNQRFLSFSKGNVAVRCIDVKPNAGLVQEFWIMVKANKASTMAKLNNLEVPYEEYDFSDETKNFVKRVVKALIDNNVNVSELPTELTDQTQYS